MTQRLLMTPFPLVTMVCATQMKMQMHPLANSILVGAFAMTTFAMTTSPGFGRNCGFRSLLSTIPFASASASCFPFATIGIYDFPQASISQG